MKHVILLLSIFLIIMPLHGQKKKQVVSKKIKSTTEMYEDVEDKPGKQVKAMYTRFDDAGNVVEEIDYDKDGNIKTHFIFEYDKEGNKIKETELNSKGKEISHIINEFDKFGNKIKEQHFKANGVKDKDVQYKYQDSLRIEKIVYTPAGKIKNKRKYIYNYR